jgi:hypothetical protein
MASGEAAGCHSRCTRDMAHVPDLGRTREQVWKGLCVMSASRTTWLRLVFRPLASGF